MEGVIREGVGILHQICKVRGEVLIAGGMLINGNGGNRWQFCLRTDTSIMLHRVTSKNADWKTVYLLNIFPG